MKHLTTALITLCAFGAWCTGVAAQDAAARDAALFGFEYGGGASEVGLWWMRHTDEATLQFSNWTRVDSSSRPKGIPGSRSGGMEALDRPFFIGNTIANLRGLDPTFGSRILALTNGRAQPASPRPPATPPPPRPIDLPDDVWLLKQDGTIIRPLRKTPVADDQQYCTERRCEQGYVYGFPLSAATEAVAVAFSSNGVVSTRKLQSLAGLAQ